MALESGNTATAATLVADAFGHEYAAILLRVAPQTLRSWINGSTHASGENLPRLDLLHEIAQILSPFSKQDDFDIIWEINHAIRGEETTLVKLITDPAITYSPHARREAIRLAERIAGIPHEKDIAHPQSLPLGELFLELLRTSESSACIVKRDATFVYVRPQLAITQAKEAAVTRGQDFNPTSNALSRSLVQLGFLKPTTDGRTQASIRVDGEKTRVWRLPSRVL